MPQRSTGGRETWRRLLEWDRGQSDAERLAAHVLRLDGFKAIDPAHPLGGRDGLKDVICRRGSDKWIGAAYFARGQQTFGTIAAKLAEDVVGVEKNDASGIAFVTNQELTLGKRDKLIDSHKGIELELYHLERVSSLLDSPMCYGLRLEFLDIEMNKEEQLSYMAIKDAALTELKDAIESMSSSSADRLYAPPATADAEIPTVTPRDVGFPHATSSLFEPDYVECKGCEGVYKVAPSYTYSYTLSLGGSFRVVTCPYCGRTQKWFGL